MFVHLQRPSSVLEESVAQIWVYILMFQCSVEVEWGDAVKGRAVVYEDECVCGGSEPLDGAVCNSGVKRPWTNSNEEKLEVEELRENITTEHQ